MEQQQRQVKEGESKASKKNGDKGNRAKTIPGQVEEKSTVVQITKTVGCFICNGSRPTKDCPKEKLNASVVEEGSDYSELEVIPQMNPLQLFNVIQAKQTHKGLIHVEVKIGGQSVELFQVGVGLSAPISLPKH